MKEDDLVTIMAQLHLAYPRERQGLTLYLNQQLKEKLLHLLKDK